MCSNKFNIVRLRDIYAGSHDAIITKPNESSHDAILRSHGLRSDDGNKIEFDLEDRQWYYESKAFDPLPEDKELINAYYNEKIGTIDGLVYWLHNSGMHCHDSLEVMLDNNADSNEVKAIRKSIESFSALCDMVEDTPWEVEHLIGIAMEVRITSMEEKLKERLMTAYPTVYAGIQKANDRFEHTVAIARKNFSTYGDTYPVQLKRLETIVKRATTIRDKALEPLNFELNSYKQMYSYRMEQVDIDKVKIALKASKNADYSAGLQSKWNDLVSDWACAFAKVENRNEAWKDVPKNDRERDMKLRKELEESEKYGAEFGKDVFEQQPGEPVKILDEIEHGTTTY